MERSSKSRRKSKTKKKSKSKPQNSPSKVDPPITDGSRAVSEQSLKVKLKPKCQEAVENGATAATPASSKLNPSPSQNLDAANQRRWNPANNNSQSKTTLRWAGQLDDPDEESKRIEIYKARRRERYAKYVLQSQSPNTNYQCQPITFKIPNIYATASGSNRLSSLYKTTPAMSKVLSMT